MSKQAPAAESGQRRRRRVQPQVAAPLPGGVPELTPENIHNTAGTGVPVPDDSAAMSPSEVGTQTPVDAPQADDTATASTAGAALPAQASPKGTAGSQPAALEGTVVPNDPAEQLDFYEAQVFAARRDLIADVHRYEDRLQKPLHGIKSNKLWQTKVAGDGKPFRSWSQYVEERLPDISLATADRIIVHVPIERALGTRTSVRQDEVLWPIFRDRGASAVLETWNKAMELGRPTPENLRIARDQLGFGKDEKLELATPARAELGSPVQRAEKQLTQLKKLPLGSIRSSAPDEAKRLAGELRSLADQLESDVETPSENGSTV